ncbi:helix-turn-helix domain-containing protein [Eubacteriaceae bacterium ES2]|nr:helix-turn-helix domain-containing protein [Eubacteriaceae bacterium ES2]
MKVKLAMILDKLNGCKYEYFPSSENKQNAFTSVRLLNGNTQNYRADVLYLGSSERLNHIEYSKLPQTVICIETKSSPLILEKTRGIELALVREAVDVFKLREQIEDILGDYSDIYGEMLQKVIDNRGLEAIINAMTLILGNPFYVADADFKILARTGCVLKNPDEWRYIIEHGIEDDYISSSINDFYYMRDLMKKTENRVEAVFFCGNELYPHSFYSMNLRSRNQKIGLATVFQTERPFSIATKAILEFFSEIIILEILKNQTIQSNEGVKLGYLFSEILAGNENSENELFKVTQFMEIGFPENFYILAIKAEKIVRNRYELTFLRKRITQLLPNTICIIYQNTIVILTDEKNSTYWIQSKNILHSWLAEKEMVAGISELGCDVSQIKNAYQQSLIAVEIGLKTKPHELIFDYQQIRFLHLLKLIGQLENWSSLLHPALNRLRAYDVEKGSDLFKTLDVYMKNGRSQAKTAKVLHVHRSSLQYRLSKIESVMGISLDDYQTFLHLQLSIEVENA